MTLQHLQQTKNKISPIFCLFSDLVSLRFQSKILPSYASELFTRQDMRLAQFNSLINNARRTTEQANMSFLLCTPSKVKELLISEFTFRLFTSFLARNRKHYI